MPRRVGRARRAGGSPPEGPGPDRTPSPRRTLIVDIGGTHVKLALPGRRSELVLPSGPTLSPSQLLREVRRRAPASLYDRVSIGFPGPVVNGRPIAEPHNLGKGWVGFDFRRAFHRPVRVVNDAVLQALGSYTGGRMLFLGLGTGLGSAMVVGGRVEPMELGHLPYRKGRTYEDYVGDRGLRRLGKRKWRRRVRDVVERLRAAMLPEYVVLGGGNARFVKRLPAHTRLVDNRSAILGGRRLWEPAWRQGLGEPVV